MPYYGHIKNGVIVLEGQVLLGEGTLVRIEPVSETEQEKKDKPHREWKGIFRHAGPVPTERDINEMRKEAWPE